MKKATLSPGQENKKDKKRKKGGNVPRQHKKKKKKKRKKEKKRGIGCTWAFLSIKQHHFLLLDFSPIWEENFLVGQGRKHLSPIIYFPSSPLNQTHSKKFSFPFSLQSFLSTLFHLLINKHTLSRQKQNMRKFIINQCLRSHLLKHIVASIDKISHKWHVSSQESIIIYA